MFLAYAREDEDFVLRLAHLLKRRGVNVWVDQLDVPAGADWEKVTTEALQECATLLIVLSPASTKSPEVQAELRTP